MSQKNICKNVVPACLIFCSPFVVDTVQTKITSAVPIWFQKKGLNTIRSESAILKFYNRKLHWLGWVG